MERRNRDRLNMTAFCRIAPAANSRRTSWKTIENISGAGMLLVWSRGESESRPPRTGDRYTVEVQLPSHPAFGQRALQFATKVVRVFESRGKLMVGLQTTQARFKSIRGRTWIDSRDSTTVN
jgi:c-di-GMP-binding flagellar brake protein YcgR